MVPLKMESGGGGSGSLPRPHRCFVDVRGVEKEDSGRERSPDLMRHERLEGT